MTGKETIPQVTFTVTQHSVPGQTLGQCPSLASDTSSESSGGSEPQPPLLSKHPPTDSVAVTLPSRTHPEIVDPNARFSFLQWLLQGAGDEPFPLVARRWRDNDGDYQHLEQVVETFSNRCTSPGRTQKAPTQESSSKGQSANRAPSEAPSRVRKHAVKNQPTVNAFKSKGSDKEQLLLGRAVFRLTTNQWDFTCYWFKKWPGDHPDCCTFHVKTERAVRENHADIHRSKGHITEEIHLRLKHLRGQLHARGALEGLTKQAKEIAVWQEGFVLVSPEDVQRKTLLNPFVGALFVNGPGSETILERPVTVLAHSDIARPASALSALLPPSDTDHSQTNTDGSPLNLPRTAVPNMTGPNADYANSQGSFGLSPIAGPARRIPRSADLIDACQATPVPESRTVPFQTQERVQELLRSSHSVECEGMIFHLQQPMAQSLENQQWPPESALQPYSTQSPQLHTSNQPQSAAMQDTQPPVTVFPTKHHLENHQAHSSASMLLAGGTLLAPGIWSAFQSFASRRVPSRPSSHHPPHPSFPQNKPSHSTPSLTSGNTGASTNPNFTYTAEPQTPPSDQPGPTREQIMQTSLPEIDASNKPSETSEYFDSPEVDDYDDDIFSMFEDIHQG